MGDANQRAIENAVAELANRVGEIGIGSSPLNSIEWERQRQEATALEALSFVAARPGAGEQSALNLITDAVIRIERFVNFEYALRPVLHDLVGNPFRPITFAPEWHTDTAVAVAGRMYESRDFSAMPILADALQDAGCDSEHILNHCRDATATHVRGCWVVDLVLRKE